MGDIWDKKAKPDKEEKHLHKWIQKLAKYHAHEMTAILKQFEADKVNYKKDYKKDIKEDMTFDEFRANYGLDKDDKTLEKFKIPKKEQIKGGKF